eukprot:PhM_4_TR13959/c1_g1_i1/m.31968
MDDNQTLNKRISDLEKEAAFYKAKFQEEIARNEDLQANADIAEEIFAQHQELKSTHASTKQRLSELEDQGGIITKLKDDVAVLEKDLAEARQTNHRIEAERDTLRSMATGRYEQLSDNVAALLQRSTDVTTTKSDLQSTREALDTANGKVEELSRAVEALKKALDESQRLCELQKAELRELKDKTQPQLQPDDCHRLQDALALKTEEVARLSQALEKQKLQLREIPRLRERIERLNSSAIDRMTERSMKSYENALREDIRTHAENANLDASGIADTLAKVLAQNDAKDSDVQSVLLAWRCHCDAVKERERQRT